MRARLLAWLTLALVLLLVGAPILVLCVAGEGVAWSSILGGSRARELLLRSVLVAGGATALALPLGLVTGRAAARLGRRGAAFATAVLLLPLCVPAQVTTLGWLALLGQQGTLTRQLPEWLRPNLFTPAAVAVLLALALFPCVALSVAFGQRTLEPRALAAAELAAGPRAVFWRIELSWLAPWLASGAALTFLLAFMDFGVPSALMVNLYPVEVFSQLGALQDLPRALASAAGGLPVVALVLVLRVASARLAPWPGTPQVRSTCVATRTELGLATGVLALSLLVPLVALVLAARGFHAQALRTAGREVLTSLQVAGGAALLATVLAALLVLVTRRLGGRAGAWVLAATSVGALVPGALVGLGLLTLVARDVPFFGALAGSRALLVLACVTRFLVLPLALLQLGAGVLRGELLTAATLHGAGAWRSATRIVAPLLAPVCVAGAGLVFVFALGELPAAVLVAPPGAMTLAVRIESLLHFGKDGLVAALCLVEVGLVLAVAGLAGLIALPGKGGALRAPRAR